jgi:hypothetical protein
MTIIREGDPGNAKERVAMEVSHEEMCRAFEYYANEVLFKSPIFVKSVQKSTTTGYAFRVEYVPALPISSPTEDEDE